MPGVRPAQAILNEIRNGALMLDIAQHLHDATEAAHTHGKKASVTIKIDITPQNKHMVDPVFAITGEASSTLPKPDVQVTLFGMDEDSNLTRNLTRSQQGLNLTIERQAGAGEK